MIIPVSSIFGRVEDFDREKYAIPETRNYSANVGNYTSIGQGNYGSAMYTVKTKPDFKYE